ncbi:MAG: M48 family peptidase, partial [Calditrichia bacterium]|nr:M48 family peptidase [Calditrichia bacterium]
MNIFAIIILITMLFSYILGLIADTLNIKALHPQLPEEFKDIFDSDKYKKSQEYTKVNTRFGLISGTFSLVVTLAFWFAGGFNFLDQFVRSFEFSFIWNGLMFIGLLLLGNFFISLPFGIYSTFVIEEKF